MFTPVFYSRFREFLYILSTTNDFNYYHRSHVHVCHQQVVNVAFLKVHKTGGTTVSNIFLRYGDSRGLNIALPKLNNPKWNYLGFNTVLQKDRIFPIPPNETYNILCNHAIYSGNSFRELLGADVVNIGIIREPVSQFVSAAHFFGLLRELQFKLKNKNKSELISKFSKNTNLCPDSLKSYMHNRMSLDFGLKAKDFDNETAINEYMRSLDQDFALVIVTEYFDESLVLLKRILCLNLKDVLYIPLNVNTRKKREPIKVSEEDKFNIRKYNHADFKLYQYFKDKLIKQLDKSGHNINHEVQNFKSIRKSVMNFCNERKSEKFSKSKVFEIGETVWNDNFTITTKECEVMMEYEFKTVKRLTKKAEERFKISKR
ncbi:GAL3ST1 [Mytilus coruscus]|uniref:GAL3ST1 n=1 Tax=Mytilus coruscus TaxID=42192 RepID=A0A6J8BT29_MYTCO|nr:GAL3ST1 [Mytilus coruscus]